MVFYLIAKSAQSPIKTTEKQTKPNKRRRINNEKQKEKAKHPQKGTEKIYSFTQFTKNANHC